MVEVSDTRCEWADRSIWHDLHVGIVEKSLKFELERLESFKDFLLVNMRLEKITVRETMQDARRFLEASNCVVSYDAVKRYLESYVGKKPKTYNSQITSLRRFLRDFLKVPDAIMSFKMAAVDEWHFNENLPSREQVAKGFKALESLQEKAIYLFTASTGLRKSEILGLLKNQVNHETHLILAQHFTRRKRSGITFYNSEVSDLLGKYLSERADNSDKLFPISDRAWREIWEKASKSAGVKVTAKTLRAWFSTEMGELGTPDRFVDVFQGRAPRTVLAKHYTGKGLETLRRIYERARLRVFD